MRVINACGGRKFVLSVGCGAVCSLLLYLGKLSDGGFVAIIMGTVGAYIAGDVTERIKAPAQPPTPPPQ